MRGNGLRVQPRRDARSAAGGLCDMRKISWARTAKICPVTSRAASLARQTASGAIFASHRLELFARAFWSSVSVGIEPIMRLQRKARCSWSDTCTCHIERDGLGQADDAELAANSSPGRGCRPAGGRSHVHVAARFRDLNAGGPRGDRKNDRLGAHRHGAPISGDRLKKKRSRKMPALFHYHIKSMNESRRTGPSGLRIPSRRRCRCCGHRSAAGGTISSTTFCAGAASRPSPFRMSRYR